MHLGTLRPHFMPAMGAGYPPLFLLFGDVMPDQKINEAQVEENSPPAENAAAPAENIKKSPNAFTFRRMSGLDQAILQTDWEWQNLGKLDQKLWMAMSCPTHGLEFNARTLALLDPDNDGRIRSADILDAVAWVCERVRHPSRLKEGGNNLPIDNLRDDTEAGREISAAAYLVLEKSDAPNAEKVSPAQIETVLEEAEGYAFNGDGIVPVTSVPDGNKNLENYIRQAFAIVGAMRDASEKPGLNPDLADEFTKRLEATRDFRKRLAGATLRLAKTRQPPGPC